MFIVAPEDESKTTEKQIARVGIRALGTLPGTAWMRYSEFLSTCDQSKYNIKKFLNIKKNAIMELTGCFKKFLMNSSISFLLSSIPSEILGQIVDRIILKKMYMKHFENFIVMWPTMKDGSQIPKTFHKVFNYVHEQYTVSSASEKYVKRMAQVIAPKIRQSIYERFPAKYNERLKNNISILPYIARAFAAFGFSLASAWADDKLDIYDNIEKKIKLWIDRDKEDIEDKKEFENESVIEFVKDSTDSEDESSDESEHEDGGELVYEEGYESEENNRKNPTPRSRHTPTNSLKWLNFCNDGISEAQKRSSFKPIFKNTEG
jgi:hypothetical protein